MKGLIIMINKVGMFNQPKSYSLNNQPVPTAPQEPVTAPAPAPVDGQKLSSALKAMNNISFGKVTEAKPNPNNPAIKYIQSTEILVPDLFNLDENIDLPRVDTPNESKKLNAAGLNIQTEDIEGNKRKVSVSNDRGHIIFVGQVDKDADIPTVEYRQGKFLPEVTISDPSLEDKKIKMFAGSKVEGNGFKFRMPGTYDSVDTASEMKNIRIRNIDTDVSFSGRAVISTLNKEPRTLEAVDKYSQSGLQAEAIPGDYADEVKENDPTIMVPAGGFGERFSNMSGVENKPSSKLPTDDRYRIIATTLNMAASGGILDGENDHISYLSQNNQIEGENIYPVNRYKTDGGAIAEGLTRDIIPNDKDLVILNADIFTNADMTRTYHALKSLPDAALVIPYYPVNGERAKAFGLLGVEQDENGNLSIKSFVEKPSYTTDAPLPTDFEIPGDYDKAMDKFDKVQTARNPENEDQFLANPGMYFLSKEAAKVLMALGIVDPSKTGLGDDVMRKIIEMCNNGDLKTKDGKPMKVYTVPLEAKGGKPAVWDDIGTAEAYLGLVKDVSRETMLHGTSEANKYYGMPEFVLNDFVKNTDLERGIVFDSQEARTALHNFEDKYNAKVTGNTYLAE